MLQASSWNITPTQFQRSTFPPEWQSRISVIHDGIDTNLATPELDVVPLTLPDGTILTKGELTITFVNRRIEPYRGCHPLFVLFLKFSEIIHRLVLLWLVLPKV